MKILEALAASGLRSIRFAKELKGVREIITNDLSRSAAESIRRNADHNGVSHLVTPSCDDAT
jgi:tRNA (guanine26-N2/guanine27-N2)-dimethyltransferase